MPNASNEGASKTAAPKDENAERYKKTLFLPDTNFPMRAGLMFPGSE